MKNTHKKGSVEVDRDEFLRTIVLEYYEDGYLKDEASNQQFARQFPCERFLYK
jgi:hypothetical protein